MQETVRTGLEYHDQHITGMDSLERLCRAMPAMPNSGQNSLPNNSQSDKIIPFEGPRDLATVTARPPALFLSEPKASERFWEFFTANIRNRNTRRAYYKAACRFSGWCEGRGPHDLARVKPIVDCR